MQEILQENSDQPIDKREKLKQDFEEYLRSLSGRDVFHTKRIESRMHDFQRRLEKLQSDTDVKIYDERIEIEEETRERLRAAVEYPFSPHDFGVLNKDYIHRLGRQILYADMILLLKRLGVQISEDNCYIHFSFKDKHVMRRHGAFGSRSGLLVTRNAARLFNELGVPKHAFLELKKV